MPNVYFTKFNINEKIYDLYNEKESLEKLQKIVYESLSTEIELVEVVRKKVTNFKFINLFRDPENMVINGRLVAYAPGTHISYDADKDDVIETADNKKATYVTFSFDVEAEVIGFVTKFDFGRNQFLSRFKLLLEAAAPSIGEVELFLETDNQLLKDRLAKLEHVQEVAINLIPPNNDKQLFEKLFDLDPDKLNETGGTKFFLKIRGSAKKGLELSSNYMRNIINGISIGYGNLTVKGRDSSNEEIRVKSDKDALYTRTVSEVNKDSIPEISEKTRAGIVTLSINRTLVKKEYDAVVVKDELVRMLIEDDTTGKPEDDN